MTKEYILNQAEYVVLTEIPYKAPYELTKGHESDSGYDVRCLEDTYLLPGETKLIGTGVQVELPEGYECQVRPKSSLSSQGILIHLGTVDQGYRGEIMVTATNLNRVGDTTVRFREFQKIAQLVFTERSSVNTKQVEVIDIKTTRGDKGFGSTGKF